MSKQAYTATITKNPNTNRFDVMMGAIGGDQVFRHGSYATYGRAEKAAKKVEAMK